ncbi:MAG: type II toxin-antitoxin system RelE/ParE family toxin [Raoultibacter sp.]
MIISFKDADVEALTQGVRVRRFVAFEKVARRKLRQLEIAASLDDLKIPPGNRLEPLKGDRAGFFSIRINDQYRICFQWDTSGAHDVEIIDYHK